ncbi:MAG: sulfatase, partial [Chthoniobacteraceae bacterium]
MIPKTLLRSASHQSRCCEFGILVAGFVFVAVLINAGRAAQVAAAAPPTGDGIKRPLNVLFLVSDDLRPELGCYGNTVIKSPNIDRLAERGMVFNRAYCQQAVCSPSRSSVMTGMRPDTTKVWDLNTHFRKALPAAVTLPQLFKNHGYFTQGMGKIYHGDLLDPPSWSATAAALMGQDPDVVPTKRTGATKKKKAESKPANDAENENPAKLTSTNRGPAFRATDEPPNGGGEGKLADEAIAALRKFKANAQQFFLAVGFHKPHLPFVSPKAYWDLYDPIKIPLADNQFVPKGAPAYALVNKPELWSYSGVPDVSHLPEDYARQLKHGYYAAVSYMDAQLGRVLDELDKLGLRENTIVILWGDHGWKLGEHDRWAKHSNVENDTHAPLIISVPGMKAVGKKTDALVEFVDMYPTLTELAGLPLPGDLEGTSFTPLLDDSNRPWKLAAFSQYPRTVKGQKLMGYSMRTDRYRFTRWVDRDDHTKVDAVELYDHQTDPQENINIANDPANKALVEKLTVQSLAGWTGSVAPTARPVRAESDDSAVRSPASKPFVHPGLLHSREELEFVKHRVAAAEEPWK